MAKPPPAPDDEFVLTPQKKGGSAIPWVLTVLGFGAAAGVYFGLAHPATDRAGKAEAALADAKKQTDAAKKEAETAKAATAELEKAREENKGLRDDLAKTAADKEKDNKLLDDLKKQVGDGGEIKGEGSRITVTMVDKILFKSGNSDLTPQGEVVLRKLGTVLKGVEGKMVEVCGHADNQAVESAMKELYPSNWELSTARATNVVRFLQDEAGIPPRRLKASGFGSSRPVATNKTAVGRAKNRRIEVLLLPEKIKVVKGDFADEIAAAQPAAGKGTKDARPKDSDRVKALMAAKAKPVGKPAPKKKK